MVEKTKETKATKSLSYYTQRIEELQVRKIKTSSKSFYFIFFI